MIGWRWWRRAGRRTNLGVFVLLVAAFATGWLAFAAAAPAWARLVTLAHGAFGLGLLLLAPWKTVVVRRAPALRVASLLLLGVVLICLGAGFVQVFAGYGVVAGISPIQVHVGSAILLIGLLGWHLFRHRPQRWRKADLSRRSVLRTAAFAAGIGTVYAAVDGFGRMVTPAARRAPTGSHALLPSAIPPTNWLLDPVPVLTADHRVDIAGRTWSVAELTARARPVDARLDCTSGWYADARWDGVRLVDLLPTPPPSAVSVTITSVTGYHRSFPLDDAARMWLAVRCDGRPLTTGSGFPVRLVVPDRRGFWWVKWVGSVRFNERPSWVQLPFPLQ